MLDAYIIDRIRRERERERHKDARVPIYIDDRGPRREPREEERDTPPRGSVVIEYSA